MKLDVGCGRNPRPGYTPLDLHVKGAGYIACAAWKTPIADSSVTEIYARHSLEHLSPEEADATLEEWKRIMTPGAVAEVIVPDLLYHAKQLTMPGMSEFLPHETNFNHAINSIYGWQDKGGEGMLHKWGYTVTTLCKLFSSHGFEVKVIPCRACDIQIEARKPE